MDCNACDRTQPPDTQVLENERIQQAAYRLACLLVAAPEFERFTHLAVNVRTDSEVSRLVEQINGGQDTVWQDLDPAAQIAAQMELEDQLESLPIVQQYRQAEQAAKVLFNAVDDIISEAVGVDFSKYAKPDGCG